MSDEPDIDEKLRRASVEQTLDTWPIYSPADSRAKSRTRTLTREITEPDGTKSIATVEIGFSHLGMLTTEDQKLLYALFWLWAESGRPDDLEISLRQICRALKRPWGQPQRHRIIAGLRRLASTPMTWTRAFFDSRKREPVRHLKEFRIIAELEITERGPGNRSTTSCKLRFHDLVLANLHNFHARPVLLNTLLCFESGIAQLIYRWADPLLFAHGRLSRLTTELFTALGLDADTYKYPSTRKRIIERAIEELSGKPLSGGGHMQCSIVDAKSKNDYVLIIEKVETPTERSDSASLARKIIIEFHTVFRGMTEETIRPTKKELQQATDIISTYGEEIAVGLVRFARVAAGRTNYAPETFGGIVQYIGRLAAAKLRNENTDDTQAKGTGCTFCQDSHLFEAIDASGRAIHVPCPHGADAQTRLLGWARERGLTYFDPRLSPSYDAPE